MPEPARPPRRRERPQGPERQAPERRAPERQGPEAGRRSGRGPGRRPGPTETRDAIIAAARDLFAEKGYDGASLRAIARAAGVDPALVHHFYGNKEGVFVAAMRFPIDPSRLVPRILGTTRDRLGETMVRVFLEVWRDEEKRASLVAMLRSAMTNDQIAVMMRQFISSALFAKAAEIHGIPLLRINAAVGQMIGVALLRYVIKVEPIASATEDELVELLAPAVQLHLAP
ncbi:TetR family transcriptional regulator [Actinomadura sp. NBRC 104412]|uniref:TetR/AcrR family transcriptional regulator n=1 Tax=Actinomadura sp. NBRC 104412 TaxID=3032203 RepID=UPI0024A3366A|nr:TetR family transcriptional regulator [Actinomadura sp. NBRC 104412]GLZ06377.1 TetR family transcriptional regulator [Actinomadura sp. NBRC 104412]